MADLDEQQKALMEMPALEPAEDEADRKLFRSLLLRSGPGSNYLNPINLTGVPLHQQSRHRTAVMAQSVPRRPMFEAEDVNVTDLVHRFQSLEMPSRVHMVRAASHIRGHIMENMWEDVNMGQRRARERHGRRGPFAKRRGRSRVMNKSANVQGRSRGKLYETTIRRKATNYELELIMKKLRLHLESGVGSVLFMHFGRTRQLLGDLTDIDLEDLKRRIRKKLERHPVVGIELADARVGGALHHPRTHSAQFTRALLRLGVAQLSLQQFTVSSDLENADKVVVDNVVHIDQDHESDIIRIELSNDLKAPIVVNNSAYSPRKRFHVRPTGAIHTESNVYAHKVHAKYASGQQVDLLEHIDNETTDLQDDLDDLTGTLDSATHLDAGTDKIVKRSAALMTTINNLVVKADETNRSTALYPPPGLLFDKGFCETSLSCLNNAQVIFQPYDNGGNEIAGRSYTFGRSEDQDDEKDGLHFQDITDVNDTMRLRLNVGKTLPSVLLVGKKDSGVPMFEIRNHAGDTMFAIDEEGAVVYKGHEDGDPKSEQHHASIALNDQSLYIGSMRISFDRPNGELIMHVIARVPAYLTALGYTLPAASTKALHRLRCARLLQVCARPRERPELKD